MSNVTLIHPAETQLSELLAWIDEEHALLIGLSDRLGRERQEACHRGDAGATANMAEVMDWLNRDLGWLQGMRTAQQMSDDGVLAAKQDNPYIPTEFAEYVRMCLSHITYRWTIAQVRGPQEGREIGRAHV